jgi:hypothetical protein
MANDKQVPENPSPKPPQRGSALLFAVFVLALVSLSGIGLLFLTNSEIRTSYVGLRDKRAFYLAEAGEEDGRMTLFGINGNNPFTDDLVSYAGANGVFDAIDPAAIQPIFDGSGALTGVTGVGDDVPVRGVTGLSNGYYMAFVTNDPLDGVATTTDTNNLVLFTGIGAGPEGEFEVVQAIVELWEVVPQMPPATITMLGPDPDFETGVSEPHLYTGDDCGGGPGKGKDKDGIGGGPGIPDFNVPVVGTVGSSAELASEGGMQSNPDYVSGDWHDADTFADLTDLTEPTLVDSGFTGLNPMWTDCDALHTFLDEMKKLATLICTDPDCELAAPALSNLTFVEGDFTVGADGGAGVLVVTGHLRYNGSASWNGMVFVFGQGEFERFGSGNGHISGAVMIADIAGADNIYGNADDCEGPDNGFNQVSFDMAGGGTAETVYCSADILGSKPNPPYRIVSFRQL